MEVRKQMVKEEIKTSVCVWRLLFRRVAKNYYPLILKSSGFLNYNSFTNKVLQISLNLAKTKSFLFKILCYDYTIVVVDTVRECSVLS